MGDGPSLDTPYVPRRPRSQVAEPQNVLRCAPAAIAPVESVQPEHAVDGVQFGSLINLECATVTENSGPSSFVSQNARKSFSAGKFGNRS